MRWLPGSRGAAVLTLLHACGTDTATSPPIQVGGPQFGFQIGTEGGVAASDSFTLEVAPGALEEMVTININQTFGVRVPEGLVMIGPAYHVEPEDTEFAVPALVGVDLGTVSLGSATPDLYLSSDGQTFERVQGSALDPGFARVTGSIEHLGFVAVLADGRDLVGGRGGNAGGGGLGGFDAIGGGGTGGEGGV